MTKENAIEKVKKLLNLNTANGASEGEMHNALISAQNLMAKYGIAQSDIIIEDSNDIVEEAFTFGTKSVSAVQSILAVNLSKHFGVEVLLVQNSNRAQEIRIIGETSKVAIFVDMLTYTYNCFKSFWSKYHKTLPADVSKSKARGDYFYGFLHGVLRTLIRNENDHALVVQSSDVLKKYMKDNHSDCSIKEANVVTDNDRTHSLVGYVDGQHSVQGKNKALDC